MMEQGPFIRVKRKASPARLNLRIALLEGIPALIIQNLLWGPLMTAYLLHLGASSAEIGLIVAIPPFANLLQIVAALNMHRLANRRLWLFWFGTLHRVLWVLTGLIPVLLPEMFWVPAFTALILLAFSSASLGSVVWTSIMADMVPPSVRGRYFGIRNTVLWAFGGAALLIGGWVLKWFPGAEGFYILYAVSAVCVVWNGLALFRYPSLQFQEEEHADKKELLLIPFKDRAYMRAVSFITVFVLLQNVVVPLFSYIMLDILEIDVEWVSAITFVHIFSIMVSNYFWGELNRRMSTRKLLTWTYPVIASSCLVWPLLEWFPAVVVMLLANVLLGVGLGGTNLLFFNFVIGDTPKTERSMYIAAFSALTGLAGFFGPMAGGVLFDSLGNAAYWVRAYGLVAAVGAVLLLLSFAARRLFGRSA